MKANKTSETIKDKAYTLTRTGYNYRTRKHRDILAVVLDANDEVLDAIFPGTGTHRMALDWAEWRAESILNDYHAAVRMEIYNGDEEIIVIEFDKKEATTMNANETKNTNIAHAERIYKEIDAIKMRGAWENGVKEYALMLIDWYKTQANDKPLTLETLLNGAKDWRQYAYGACGVAKIWNTDIAETLCTPSELRRTNGGIKAPNARETWQDVEARALYQAYFLIQKFNNERQ